TDGARAAATAAISWKLTGTIATRNPNEGYAIVGEPAKSGQLRHTGADLGDGSRLYQVFQDRVVLDVHGRFETLTLPRFALETTPNVHVNVAAASAEVPAAEHVNVNPDAPGAVDLKMAAQSAAENWFAPFNGNSEGLGGQGMVMHPGK